MASETLAGESDALTFEEPLAEVHSGSDLALRVRVTWPPAPTAKRADDETGSGEVALETAPELRPGETAATEADDTASIEVPASAGMGLRVTVLCPSKCNLQGGIVRIASENGPVVERIRLVSFDGSANRTVEFLVKAPPKPGKYTWAVVFAAQEKDGILHEESVAPFSFVVRRHVTSMAVWDMPSPVAVGTQLRAKVGVSCDAACDISGRDFEIYDQKGSRVATVPLGDRRWSDTGALYWSEIEVDGPGIEGLYTWEARFPKPDLELPHDGASYPFSFQIVGRPDHVVTVAVTDSETKAPIESADVILLPYRCRTDADGLARLAVPKGDYELYVAATRKVTSSTSLKVAGDVNVNLELLPAPPSDDGDF